MPRTSKFVGSARLVTRRPEGLGRVRARQQTALAAEISLSRRSLMLSAMAAAPKLGASLTAIRLFVVP